MSTVTSKKKRLPPDCVMYVRIKTFGFEVHKKQKKIKVRQLA